MIPDGNITDILEFDDFESKVPSQPKFAYRKSLLANVPACQTP